MSGMFGGCSSLTTLDVSGFNTGKVENMNGMFFGSSLTTLDVSGFDTGKVTNMSYMFYSCSDLKTILVCDNFTTTDDTSSDHMFSGCTSLVGGNGTTFDEDYTDKTYARIDAEDTPGYFTNKAACVANAVLSTDGKKLRFVYGTPVQRPAGTVYALNSGTNDPEWTANTEKTNITAVVFEPLFINALPTTTRKWFSGFSSLTTIVGMEYLNTSEVTNMSEMFSGCSSLKFIPASSAFTTSKVTSSDGMFSGCSSLVGGSGTVYSSSQTDATYAHIDGGTSNPGYFTDYTTYTMKAVLSGSTLTFYYDANAHNGEGTIYALNSGNDDPDWLKNSSSITTVVFDASFANARPTSTYSWFYYFSNLTAITGIEYLNTSEVTDMSGMFFGCSSLTTLDVSGFDTGNVENMYSMFYGCSSLTTLDLSGFDTGNVKEMRSMFSNCKKFTTLDLSGFNTANVTNMSGMFGGCSSLTTLDVSGFNTANVTDMSGMFWGSSLTTLDVSGFNTAKVGDMSDMFYGCRQFTTLDLSGFNTSEVENMDDMFYGCESLTALDVSGFDTGKVENMNGMFLGCSSLTTLDLSGFNTAEVKYMFHMFSGCESLTALDLSGFNTANVTNMSNMFYQCSSLTTLDLSGFDTGNVKEMRSMFYGCSNLKTILVGNDFTLKDGLSSDHMFYGCSSLVGGSGTKYNSSYTDKTYAHIDGGDGNPGYFTNCSTFLTLSNSADNTFAITNNTGTKNVLLSGRTLYRDGYWNTLCLPFNASLTDDNSPLKGATAMSLNSASFDASSGTLTLGFTSVTGTLTAGTPYIIKWEDSDNSLIDLGNPVFQGVNVAGADLVSVTFADVITFTGTYGYQKFTADDRSILFMGAENTLYYPTAGAEIGACRAYFQLADGLTAGDPSTSNGIKAFVLNFDEDSESTSISTIDADAPAADTWFTLDGRRLLEAPEQPGLYIRNGHKVLLK